MEHTAGVKFDSLTHKIMMFENLHLDPDSVRCVQCFSPLFADRTQQGGNRVSVYA